MGSVHPQEWTISLIAFTWETLMGKLGMKRVTDEMQGRGQGSTGTRRFVTQHCPLDIIVVCIIIMIVIIVFVSHDDGKERVVLLLWGSNLGRPSYEIKHRTRRPWAPRRLARAIRRVLTTPMPQFPHTYINKSLLSLCLYNGGIVRRRLTR